MAGLITVGEADAQAPVWLPTADSTSWLALPEVDRTRHILNASTYFSATYRCTFDVAEASPLPAAVIEAIALLAFLDWQSALVDESASTSGGAVISESKAVGSLKLAKTYASGTTTSTRNRLGRVTAVLSAFTLDDGSAASCRIGSRGRRLVRN